MQYLKYLSLFSMFIISRNTLFSQGCSDAGFCSLKYHTDGKVEKPTKNDFTFEVTYGIGEDNVTSLTPAITYTRKFNSKIAWSNKVTANYFNGNLGSKANLGDLYSTVNFALQNNNKAKWNILGGVKIPFTNGNDKLNNKSLPMSYQSSLGTVDALLGAAVTVQKLEFTTALQIPISGANKNTYFKTGVIDTFSSTNLLVRKPDVLLRAAYNWTSASKKWSIKPNLLAIYHLGEDSFTDIANKAQTLKGSDGLTLNANIIGQYNFVSGKNIGFSIAAPLKVRTIRPDGLTRKLTLSVNYTINF
jgi:hypothetical protein